MIGAYAARKRDKAFDTVCTLTMLGLASIPEFVIGMILVIVFSARVWHLLRAVSHVGGDTRPWNDLGAMVLPTATLVLVVRPLHLRITRASLIEVMESDYVEMARLKGAPERTVMWRHALPNSLGPDVPGDRPQHRLLRRRRDRRRVPVQLSRHRRRAVEAIPVHDIPVIQFLVMVLAAVYVVCNLLADVATILVTPRLRTRLT